jgi:uncharacterized membrane protein YhaH (DUF805 family)
MGVVFCAECGGQASDTAKFCSGCGASLGQSVPSASGDQVGQSNYTARTVFRPNEPPKVNFQTARTVFRPNEPPKVNFQEAVARGFRGYFDFTGRATMAEFWWFFLFVWIVWPSAVMAELWFGGGSGIIVWSTIIGLALPSLAVSVRRLHDTNRSGWWVLMNLIPFGVLVLLTFFLDGSTEYPNKFDAI